MRRRLLHLARVAGASALLAASAPLPATRAAGGGYADLVALFQEWRAFQRPVFKGGVPDYTPSGMEAQKARLPEFQKRLQAIAPGGWPVAQQVDWRLVQAEMNGLDFDHRVLRPWARDPGFYSVLIAEQSDTPSKEGTIFAGAIETWRMALPLPASEVEPFRARLRAIPAVLAQARANLVADTRDLWRAGIHAQQEQSAALADLAKRVAPHHPDLVPDIDKARVAVDEFRAWLDAGLPGKWGRSGVGRENYDWYLRNVHLSPYTWQDEVTLHERELARATAHLELEKVAHAGQPPSTAMDSPEAWKAAMQDAVSAYVKFLKDRGVGTVKDYMEPALRAHASSYVAPADRDFFAQVDAREPLLLRAHGYHWFDLARMEKEPHASAIRRGPLLYNMWDSRAEGLATAMEEMMASVGLFEGRPRGHELMYVMVAQRAARGLASLRVHGGDSDLGGAIQFAHDNTPYGWLKVDGDLVWGEQRLYLSLPGYGTCYLSGKAQVESLLAARQWRERERFSLTRFMDDLNASGMIPVSLIRWEMTGELPPS
ncbi:MAG TPA: DUF885 family protein [Vicinamibacteria bacterium]|nr:DUF885 family protein [Vicinamibacteria bacterium]